MCTVLSLCCTIVLWLQGHCCVCHSSIEKSVQECMCVSCVGVWLKHKAWGSFGAGVGQCSEMLRIRETLQSCYCRSVASRRRRMWWLSLHMWEGNKCNKKYKRCKISSGLNLLLPVKLVFLSLPEVSAQEKKQHSVQAAVLYIHVCKVLVPFKVLLEVS